MITTLFFGIIALVLVLWSFSYGSNRWRYRFPVQIRFSDLWRFEGKVGRGTYAFVGLAGFAIKHNIDRIIATARIRPAIYSFQLLDTAHRRSSNRHPFRQ